MGAQKDRAKLVTIKRGSYEERHEQRSPLEKQRRTTASSHPLEGHRQHGAIDSLTRTKALLLAALRVWELRRRIAD